MNSPQPAPSARRPVYLDYNSTTPMDQRVFDAMRPYFLERFGNPGSRTHAHGQEAKRAADEARERIAHLLGAQPEEIVFTSGATESNNLALLGFAQHCAVVGNRGHVLASTIEHKSVLEPLERMRGLGFEVEHVPVTSGGYVEPDAVRARLREDTLLVSLMHANNETGVLQPVVEIGELLAERGVAYHVDAAQTFGKEVEELRALRCDFLSVSGHKIYAPKGVGALYARRRGGKKRPLVPLTFGGGQEMGLRPGTLPVPLVVGLGEAARLAALEYKERNIAAAGLKLALLEALAAVEHRLNGDVARTMPHVVNVSFPGVDSEALMMALRDEVSVSNGAACTSSSYSPSHVLKAMGMEDDAIESAVRISWGLGVQEIPGRAIADTVASLRLFS